MTQQLSWAAGLFKERKVLGHQFASPLWQSPLRGKALGRLLGGHT